MLFMQAAGGHTPTRVTGHQSWVQDVSTV